MNRWPIPCWLTNYNPAWWRLDLMAGLTLAAYAIPVSLAYAGLASLPPVMGLYCYLAGGIAYALFGTSRHLAIGPTSALSLLLGVTLLELSQGDQVQLVNMASLSAVLMAAVFAAAWLLRLSVLTNFISESILAGFKAGAALVIASTQLPKLLGVVGGGDDFFTRLWVLGQQLATTNLPTLAIGGIAIFVLLAGDKLLPRWPMALVVVLLSILAVSLANLEQYGVRVVGEIPAGLPRLRLPGLSLAAFEPSVIRQLVRLAAACFLLSYIESVSAARTFAMIHKYDVDARQELLALGAASFCAGLFQGFPIAGGLSQTAVNERGGARTPLSLFFASGTICCVLLLMSGLFRSLPDAVLAAVVLVAVKGLVDLRELRHLWRVSRLDFSAAMVAFAGVLLMGILDGVLVAVIATVVMLLGRTSKPHIAFLGRIPGTHRYSDLARHPDNELLPGILAFRVQSSLLYFNADHIFETVRQMSLQQTDLRCVVGDLSNVPYVDVAGARMLRRLFDDLSARNVAFRLVEAHGAVRDLLRLEEFEGLFGSISRYDSLDETLSKELSPAG